MKSIVKQQIFIFSLLLLALCLIWAVKPVHLNSSLSGLFPNADRTQIPAEVQARISAQLNVAVEADSYENARAAADLLYQDMLRNNITDITYTMPDLTSDTAKQFIREHQYAFLTASDRANLKAGRTKKILQESIDYISTSFMPPVLSLEDDPFSLVSKYVSGLLRKPSAWKTRDGVLWQYTDAKHYILLNIAIDDTHIDKANATVEQILDCAASISGPATFHFAGVPLHTYKMYRKCKFEITLISIISGLTSLLSAFILLKKFKFVFGIFLNLLIAFVAGATALCLAFGEIHILSFAFGASLIGICIDYSFHKMSDTHSDIKENLRRSFGTTVCCFLPLLFSDLPILRQIAVFLLGGLIGTYFCVGLFPRTVETNASPHRPHGFLSAKTKAILLCIFSIFIVYELRSATLQNDLSGFYQPDTQTQSDDKLFYALSGLNSSDILLIKGNNLEDVLIKEENLSQQYDDATGLSFFLPSIQRQNENYDLIQELYAGEAVNIKNELGLNEIPHVRAQNPITEDNFAATFGRALLDKFIIREGNTLWSTLTTKSKIGELPTDVFRFSPQTMLHSALAEFSHNAFYSLSAGAVLLSLLIFYYYRRKTFLYLLPAALSVLGTLAVITLLFGHISLFHIISLFIVIGLSIDYTIFHLDNHVSIKPVFFSFLSSFIGFGLLSFVSFGIIAAMGQTIAVGLAISYFTSLLLIGKRAD